MSVKRWVGNASNVSDLWTISLSGTVTSQIYSMTINGKSLTYTSTSGDTVATILTALIAAWNSLVSPLPPPEFQELTAAGLPSAGPFTSMTLTGDTPGKPTTISVSTSGSATFTIANTTPATGQNDFANAQNWSGGVAPVNSDTLVFDNGSIPCKYNLSTTLTGIVLTVLPGFTGTIGLPIINADASTTYAEYRTTNLTLAGGMATINGPALQRCNLAFGAHTTTIQVTATGSRLDKYTAPVLITGGNGSSTLAITKGDIAIANYLGQTADFPIIATSFQTSAKADVTLYCGAGATLGAINQNGGSVTVNSAVTTFTVGTSGGTATILAGAISTLTIEGGTAICNSTGTFGTITISGSAVLDFSQDPNGKSIVNPILVYGEKTQISDPQKVVNSGVLSVTTNQAVSFNVNHGSGNVCTFT